MKLLKNLFIVLFMSVLSLPLVSCGDDKEEPENVQSETMAMLVGNWLENSGSYGWVLLPDGSGYDYAWSSGQQQIDELLKWSVSGSKLVIVYEGSGTVVYEIMSLTNTQLYIKDEYGDTRRMYRQS